MYLDNLSEQDVMELNIPTGVPLVYELDEDLKPIRKLLSRRSGNNRASHAGCGKSGENITLAMSSTHPFHLVRTIVFIVA